MAVGERLSDDDRRRIESAVHAAEQATGMQFLVYLGKARRDARSHARSLLHKLGYDSTASVLIFVAPGHRRVEVATTEQARRRISDEACAHAIEIMVPAFRNNDWVAGIELGVADLAEQATPEVEDSGSSGGAANQELPDIIE